MNMKAQISAHN